MIFLRRILICLTTILGRYAPLVLAPAEGRHFPRFAWENYAPLIRGWGLTDGLKLKLEWGLTNGIKFSEKMFLRV